MVSGERRRVTGRYEGTSGFAGLEGEHCPGQRYLRGYETITRRRKIRSNESNAVSVPSNIAEGAARGSQRELAQFLVIARGSLSELETQLIIAKELNYLSETAKVEAKIQSILRLLGGLLNNVKKKISP